MMRIEGDKMIIEYDFIGEVHRMIEEEVREKGVKEAVETLGASEDELKEVLDAFAKIREIGMRMKERKQKRQEQSN